MITSYRTSGTCSRQIDVELDGDTIKSVKFYGGCPGNLAAISKIVVGEKAERIIQLWEGNTCGPKPTSCTDQLTKALRQALAEQNPDSAAEA